MRNHGIIGSVLLLASACTIGDGGEIAPSPYDSATIDVGTPHGVADGATGVVVDVTGPIGSRLVLVITGSASFQSPDADKTNEKTVFLTDEGGTGHATARVLSSTVGSVAVSFKPDPLRTPREIEFHPVRMAAGIGKEVAIVAGTVEHEVCVAVSSPTGVIRTGELASGAIDAEAEVSDTAPAGLDCPSTAVDEVGWHGYATLAWRTSVASAEVSLSYAVGEGDPLASETVELSGVAFPGYTVTSDAPAIGDFASVVIHVSYPAIGGLAAGPAAGVSFEQRFIPAPGPEFLGSSSGGSGELPMTDAAGDVTVFFDASAPGTYAWFATLTGGHSVQLDDLVIDVP